MENGVLDLDTDLVPKWFTEGLLEEVKPKYISFAFDQSLTSSFRNTIYPPYKANRDPAPEELKQQFDRCREVTRALGCREFASENV